MGTREEQLRDVAIAIAAAKGTAHFVALMPGDSVVMHALYAAEEALAHPTLSSIETAALMEEEVYQIMKRRWRCRERWLAEHRQVLTLAFESQARAAEAVTEAVRAAVTYACGGHHQSSAVADAAQAQEARSRAESLLSQLQEETED